MQLRDADGAMVESIPAYAGLSKRQPGLAAAMAVFLFSLAAIPPLFGFWPNYLVFEAAVNAGLVPLAFAGVVVSVIGAFSYRSEERRVGEEGGDTILFGCAP